MMYSKSCKENVPPRTASAGKTKIPRKVALKTREGKPCVPSSVPLAKKKLGQHVPNDSPKRHLESEFEKDDSALQSILNETGIEGIPEAKGPERHTLAGPSASKTPRQSIFDGLKRDTGIKNFQRICDEFIRRTSMMPPEAKRQCTEKSTEKSNAALGTPKTPKSNPFHSSPFTPRMSVGPSRVQTEKSFFGVDVKKSPAATACNTPVRTPVKKEILAFTRVYMVHTNRKDADQTAGANVGLSIEHLHCMKHFLAQRVRRTEAKDTPKPIRLAVTSVKKKKQLTWADALEDCRSPEFLHRANKGKKSLFHGQGSENDSGVSRNLCDAITSSRNDNTAEAIQDESSTGAWNEEPRVARQVEDKQHEMQGDQNQKTRTTPFTLSQDAPQLPVDIRTLSAATETLVQIQDNAQRRPSSENLGGLSHSLSTTIPVNDSQTSQTMTQLSKYPVQGQEKLSKYSQQGNSSARTSAASLEHVQQIPSHDSEKFTKYFTHGKSVQESSYYSYDISQSQTETSSTVDNSEALKTMYDNSVTIKQTLTPDILDLRQTTSEHTEVDDNGNIRTVTELTEPLYGRNQNDLFSRASAEGVHSPYVVTFTQGNTQAALYAEDRNKTVQFSEAEQVVESENVNKNVAKCDIKVKTVTATTTNSENKGTSATLGYSLVTPKLEQHVCDQISNPNILRVESNANQASPFVVDYSHIGWNISGHASQGQLENINNSRVKDTQISLADIKQTLFAPTPVRQQTSKFTEQTDSFDRLVPPILTPLAAKDIAKKHSITSTAVPNRNHGHILDEYNLNIKQETSIDDGQEDFEFPEIPAISGDSQNRQAQADLERLPSNIYSPESEIIDSFGAVDLSKSARKTKSGTSRSKLGPSQEVSNSTQEVNMSHSAVHSGRPVILGSAFHPVRRSGLSPDVGSMSLLGNMEGFRGERQNNNLNRSVLQAANNRFHEALLDEEVTRYFMQGLLGSRSLARCDNPIAKTLQEGDEMHFVPICNDETNSDGDGQLEDSAFIRYNRST